MRLLLRRGLRRRQNSTSSSTTQEQTWENTRSCPGSLRCQRKGEPPAAPPALANTYSCGLQRHNSDPGSLKARSPSPVATAFLKRQLTTDSFTGSVAISLHSDSRWSLYRPSAHWDEVFEPGRDSHFHADMAEDQNINLKQLLNAGRPRSRLRCLALIFALVYLAYAFYVTISRVNRVCRAPSTPRTTIPAL